jgi:hypothetical protein
MSTVCTARASYKKIPGLLELNSSHLQWTQDGKDGKKAPVVRVAHVEVSCTSTPLNTPQTLRGHPLTVLPLQHSFLRRRALLKCASKLASKTIAMATISRLLPPTLLQNARHSKHSSPLSSATTAPRVRRVYYNLHRQVSPLFHRPLTVPHTVLLHRRRRAHRHLVPSLSQVPEARL